MATTAATKEEWWSLVRKDLVNWNIKAHPEDRMSLPDWAGEIGVSYGWRPFMDQYGDWDIERV
jgi:hypothetical protein